MSLTQEQYLQQLMALQPTGAALPAEADSTWGQLLAAMAKGLADVDARADDLVAESDPRSALEMLPDWERVTGLPDDCSLDADTLQERRAAVVAKLRSTGGQSVAYFQALAESLGYEVVITEYRPFVCGISHCGEDALNGDHDVRYVWDVLVLGPRLTWFRVGESECGVDHLLEISTAEDLECLLRRFCPAQTTLIIGYGGE